jgi:hypothetical protein
LCQVAQEFWKLFDGELFGAEAGFGAAGDGGVELGEVVLERLAFLQEAAADELPQIGRDERARPRRDADDGGIHFRRRGERARRHREEIFDVPGELGDDAEITVIARAGFGREAFGHFLLHEEDGALEPRADGEHMFDDGRGDVVGQIATDGAVFGWLEVVAENIGFDDFDLREGNGERRDQVAIEFEGNEALAAVHKVAGERAATGADFVKQRFTGGRGGFGDARQDGFVAQEVLTESPGQAPIVPP